MPTGVGGTLFDGISHGNLDSALKGLRRESILSIFVVDASEHISRLGDKVKPRLLCCSAEQDVSPCIGEEVNGISQQFNDQGS